MPAFSDCAYILHQRPYRENSVIVDLLTKENGRLSAVCQSVRSASKKASSNRALLQLFGELSISLSGRTELKTLTQLDVVSKAYRYEKHGLYAALYINELLVRLTHAHDPLQCIYLHYKNTLSALEQAGQDVEKIEQALRRFELALLKLLGFEIDFYKDNENHSITAEQTYLFHPDQGFRQFEDSESPVQNAGGVVLSGAQIIVLQTMQYDSPTSLRTIKKLTRHALNNLLGGKPLQSRLFYQRV